MFKERLNKTLRFVWSDMILPFIMLVIIVSLIILIAIHAPILYYIFAWIIAVSLGIIVLIGLLAFIHWLFIEPFRNRNG